MENLQLKVKRRVKLAASILRARTWWPISRSGGLGEMFEVEWWGKDWIGILRLKCQDLHTKFCWGATKKKEQQLLVGLDMHNAV